MANITFAVNDAALANAKSYAAERSTSLNKLVSAYFASLGREHSHKSVSKTEKALLEYSLGQSNLVDTAQALGLPDAGHVLALMRVAGLPLPELTNSETERQAELGMDFFKRASAGRKVKKAVARQK